MPLSDQDDGAFVMTQAGIVPSIGARGTGNHASAFPVGHGGVVARAKRRRSHIRAFVILLIADYTAIAIAVTVSGLLRFGSLENPMVVSAAWFFALLYPLAALYARSLSPDIFTSTRSIVYTGIKAVGATNLLLILAMFCFQIGIEFSRLMIGYIAIVSIAVAFVFRILAARIVTRDTANVALSGLALIDGDTLPEAFPAYIQTAFVRDLGLSPQAQARHHVESLLTISRSFDFVRVYCPAENRLVWAEMLRCIEGHAELRLTELDTLRPISLLRRGDRYVAVLSEQPLNWRQGLAKRLLDLSVTFMLMPILLPVMAIVAVAIRLESPGPIFFRQERIGLGNRGFKMFKFRSMYHHRSDTDASQLTVRGDARVTRVGAYIRRTSIDELPQFLNVLAGDMSIVGPRPHAYGAKAGERLYWEVDHSYWHRHIAKPGITGLAQIRGFRGNTFEEQDLKSRLDADLEYIANWRLLWDVEIILATLRVLKHDRAF
jgi:polysaccharide biosynthesis protein PslA